MGNVHDTVRERLRQALDEHPDMLKVIAGRSGYSKSYFSSVANGHMKNPTIGAIWAFAEALNVKPGWLLGLEDNMIYAAFIRDWAMARNLIKGSTPEKQFVKLMEEAGELAASLARGNEDGIRDGIGDMFVVLTILAAQNGMTMEECISKAWHEIKDRKGRMIDGIFVKQADLPNEG